MSDAGPGLPPMEPGWGRRAFPCTAPGCEANLTAMPGTFFETALEHGWTVEFGRQFCPRHGDRR